MEVSFFYSLCFDNGAKRPYPLMGEKETSWSRGGQGNDRTSWLVLTLSTHSPLGLSLSLLFSLLPSQVISRYIVELVCIYARIQSLFLQVCPIISVSCHEPFDRAEFSCGIDVILYIYNICTHSLLHLLLSIFIRFNSLRSFSCVALWRWRKRSSLILLSFYSLDRFLTSTCLSSFGVVMLARVDVIDTFVL